MFAKAKTKIFVVAAVLALLCIVLNGCSQTDDETRTSVQTAGETTCAQPDDRSGENTDLDAYVTRGTETYRDFILDNVYHSDNNGDIHFNLYIPDAYDGSEPYALFITLPGYEGLYFQGVGANLRSEDYAFEAQNYNDKMIVAAPQLSDWGETSADQTVALTEYLISRYNIDENKVYINGYSGGGETGSLVMEKRPELYTAYLAVSTQWDGDLEPLAEAQTPVYMVVGEDDSYYGSGPLRDAYDELYSLYADQGLTAQQINSILVLDIKDQSYFSQRGFSDQHAGGALFAHDEEIMGWLFEK